MGNVKVMKLKIGYTDEEAFRIVDSDFDGFISLDDLKRFLIKVFKIHEETIELTKLERLFKLLD